MNTLYAAAAIAALDMDKPQTAARYGWLKSRMGALTELGRMAERHGDQAAQLIADMILQDVAVGTVTTTRAAKYKIRGLCRQAEQA